MRVFVGFVLCGLRWFSFRYPPTFGLDRAGKSVCSTAPAVVWNSPGISRRLAKLPPTRSTNTTGHAISAEGAVSFQFRAGCSAKGAAGFRADNFYFLQVLSFLIVYFVNRRLV